MSDQAPGAITIDASTRILKASDLKVRTGKGQGLKPLDLRGGAILLLDEDGRPVATIRKIPGAVVPAPLSVPAERVDSGGGGGRLTDAQRDDLLGLIRAHKQLDAGRLGEMFERKTGRSLSVLTVQKYLDQVRSA